MSGPTPSLPDRIARGGMRIAVTVTRGSATSARPLISSRLGWVTAPLLAILALALALVIAAVMVVAMLLLATLLAGGLLVARIMRPRRLPPGS